MKFENNYFSYSDESHPLVVFELTGNEATDKEMDEFIQYHDICIDTEQPIKVLYKAEKLKYISAQHRIKLGNWTKKNMNALQDKVTGVGYKLNGVVGKIILNGIFMIQKPVFPYKISDNLEKLEQWFKELTHKQAA